eukprot:SAG22_NODE_2991_length_2044_cov_1.840617_3_plen_334_part_01
MVHVETLAPATGGAASGWGQGQAAYVFEVFQGDRRVLRVAKTYEQVRAEPDGQRGRASICRPRRLNETYQYGLLTAGWLLLLTGFDLGIDRVCLCEQFTELDRSLRRPAANLGLTLPSLPSRWTGGGRGEYSSKALSLCCTSAGIPSEPVPFRAVPPSGHAFTGGGCRRRRRRRRQPAAGAAAVPLDLREHGRAPARRAGESRPRGSTCRHCCPSRLATVRSPYSCRTLVAVVAVGQVLARFLAPDGATTTTTATTATTAGQPAAAAAAAAADGYQTGLLASVLAILHYPPAACKVRHCLSAAHPRCFPLGLKQCLSLSLRSIYRHPAPPAGRL